MIEVTGNLWTYPADVRVITTNGTVKKNGECVMGRGCALEAKQRYPEIPKVLGRHLSGGKRNYPYWFPASVGICNLWTFPVKHEWFQRADIALIRASAEIIASWVDMPDKFGVAAINRVLLPRPGCGNGGLKWEDVKPILEPILDDRFHVITLG